MSIDPTDLHGQADAMRAVAELQDRAYNFGARAVAHWSFYDHGSVGGLVHGEQPPTFREMDAWRLALGTTVATNTSEYASSYSPTGHTRSERMDATFNDAPWTLAFTYPCDAPVEVTA